MTWMEFSRAVDSGNIQPVYLFTGPEAYGKREAMEKLQAALLPSGLEMLNFSVLEDATAEKILDAVETMPMMCARRLVEVRDWAPLFSGKSKNEDAEVQKILQWLKSPSPTCVLVLNTRNDPDNKKRLTKALSEQGARVEFALLGDADLYKWAAARAKALDCQVSRKAVEKLALAAGRDRTRLAGEIDKLCAYAGKGHEVLPEHVDAIVTPSLEYSVFQLMDQLLNGKMAEAQAALDALVMAGESRIGILAMLTRQLRNLAHTRLAIDEKHLSETQQQLGLKPYPARIAERQARLHPATVYTSLYTACVQADFDIKHGVLREQEALNAILMKIFLEFSRKPCNQIPSPPVK